MSEHMFGVGPGHLPRAAERIAKKHGAVLVNYDDPRGVKRHWFACPNRGFPFDRATENAVMDELRAKLPLNFPKEPHQ